MSRTAQDYAADYNLFAEYIDPDATTSREEFEAMMARIGFARPDYYEESDVRPETGYKGGFEVPVAETGEDVRFVKTTARIDKPRR